VTVNNSPAIRSNLLRNLTRSREFGIIIFILILALIVSLRAHVFFTTGNFRDILVDISILVIVSLAQSMVILTHGIDLSVGSSISLVAMMVTYTIKTYPNISLVLIILLGMALGAVLGMFNGLIIAVGKVPPIIATLGTLSIYRGMVFLYSEGKWISSYQLPEAFKMLAKGTPLGIPNIIIFAIVVAIIVYYFLNYTRTGRDIYAVGSNPDAAQYVGIRKQRIIFLVYVLTGVAAGLAGVLWASRFESAQTNTALGFELQTVAASIIGGVSISGGVGTVPGVLLGALALGMINNAVTLVRISPFWEQAAQGLLILVAVVSDILITRRVQRNKSK
jgi:rhamnose transport system permease protein